MLLQQIGTFQPTKFAYFPNSDLPCVEIHPNLQYIAFSTRAHQLILFNQKTGRTSNLYKSEHGIIDIKFSNDLILVIEKGYHQILCFSLKTQKLKKKIAGSRSQVLKLSYCRQREIFCAITHDTCSIYNEHTLAREKLLRCSTSSFIDCLFSQNGQFLFTPFKDSTFFVWDLDSYKYEQFQCEGKDLQVCANYASFVCLFNENKIWISDLNKQFGFEKLQKFWDSKIQRVDFISHVIVIQTTTTFYIAELFNEHKLTLRNIKAISGNINTFRIGGYGSIILMLSNSAKKISLLQIIDENKKVIGTPKNPLQNEGLVCCGGYSNTNGCVVSDGIQMTKICGTDVQNPQALLLHTYKTQSSANFSVDKFQQFLLKHHIFPDKHRAAAYKFILKLPISTQHFTKLQRKGLHECVQFLQKSYPLQNKKMQSIMKNVISLLAHVDPIFAEIEQLPQIVFPFVCLFGQDQFLCFEIVYRLMTHWMSFLFEEFPVPNSKFLQNVYEILQQSDPEMIRFLKSKDITFVKLTWSMLSTLFTTNLPKQAFLSLIDNMIVHPQHPQFVMFILLGYLSYNRSRIFSLRSEQDLNTFLDQEHTVSTNKFMKHVYNCYDKFNSKVTYKFHTFDFSQRQYLQMDHYPKDAVVMYRNRRRVIAEEHRKNDQQQVYREKLTEEMEKMTLQAKRNAQRQMLIAESFTYHSENQHKSRHPSINNTNKQKVRLQKILKLQKLIDELSNVLKSQQQTKHHYKQSVSMVNTTNLYDQSDRELEDLECKLLKQLTALKPNLMKRPLNSLPLPAFKQTSNKSSSTFKAFMNAEMTNKLWEIDSLDHQHNQKQWENQMLKSMKT